VNKERGKGKSEGKGLPHYQASEEENRDRRRAEEKDSMMAALGKTLSSNTSW